MNTKEAEDIIRRFAKELEQQLKNQNTVRSYCNDVRRFIAWLLSTYGADFNIREAARGDIIDFRSFLQTRNSSVASVNRCMTSLRQFFKMCSLIGLSDANPASGITGVAPGADIPRILNRKDASLMLRIAEQSGRPMDACIVLLLLHSGLRNGEICDASIGDLHITPRAGRLFVRGRRRRTMRFVYLTTRATSSMRRYLARRGGVAMSRRKREEPLFVQRDGVPLTQLTLDQIVKRIAQEAGITAATPTVLRNTCAVHLLLRGETADAVQRALGVSSVRNHLRLAELIKDGQHPY